jgi:adenine-specific DNA-methyltransferase
VRLVDVSLNPTTPPQTGTSTHSGGLVLGHGRLLVGDNKTVLRSLQSEFGEAVRLCYVDPPFNTGETFSTYGDDVPSEQWLDELTERLALVRPLLRSDGSVWLHLDDNEQHYGRIALDRVFGREAFVATVIWQKRVSRDNRGAFSRAQDYLHVYAPGGPKHWKKFRNGLTNQGVFQNPDGDPRGPWRSIPLSVQGGHGTASQTYAIVTPTGAVHWPPKGRCWAYTRDRLTALINDGRVYWPRSGSGIPRLKQFVDETKPLVPSTLWLAEEVGDNSEAKKELLRAGTPVFDTPKPRRLMQRILEISTNPGDLVLDPYFGSGTTGVVAEALERKWIGIESNEHTVNAITLPRLSASPTLTLDDDLLPGDRVETA